MLAVEKKKRLGIIGTMKSKNIKLKKIFEITSILRKNNVKHELFKKGVIIHHNNKVMYFVRDVSLLSYINRYILKY